MSGHSFCSIRIAPLSAAAAAAACTVLLFGGAASAAKSGNHSVYSDPANDNQRQSSTVYASDIRSVDVSSVDTNGVTTFRVTLADGPAKLVDGDTLDVLIDYDRNSSTGLNGFDLDLVATGHTDSATTFLFCEYETQQRSCRSLAGVWAHDTKTATGVHVVDFSIQTGVQAFYFGVIASYPASSTTTLTDIAPNTSLYTFETKADPDGDGKYGISDTCQTEAAPRRYDPNNNGCLGEFKFIREQLHAATTGPKPGFLQVQRLWVSNVPPGAFVTIKSPRGVEHPKVGSSGIARSKLICCGSRAPLLRIGSPITIRITKKPTFIGVLQRNVVRASGVKTVSRKCIPATGGKAVTCRATLKGR